MNPKKLIALVSSACVLLVTLSGCTAVEGGDPSSTGMQSILMLVAFVAFFYFAAIRPESKRKKKAQELRSSIEVGDSIITVGGMIGKVVHTSEEKITFETGADRVRIEAMKWCITENKGKGSKEAVDSQESLSS